MNLQSYSKAIFKTASSNEQLEKNLSQLKQVRDLLEENQLLKEIMANPSVDKQKKKKVLQALLQDKVERNILNFLLLLIDKGRFNELSEIVLQYENLVKKKLNILTANLITATPIDSIIKERLQHSLENLYKKNVILLTQVRPQIIGGMILMIGNQMIDESVKNRLNKLKLDLLKRPIE